MHISINEVRNIYPYLRSLYFATINTLQGVSMFYRRMVKNHLSKDISNLRMKRLTSTSLSFENHLYLAQTCFSCYTNLACIEYRKISFSHKHIHSGTKDWSAVCFLDKANVSLTSFSDTRTLQLISSFYFLVQLIIRRLIFLFIFFRI